MTEPESKNPAHPGRATSKIIGDYTKGSAPAIPAGRDESSPPADQDESPGVPGFVSWRGVYLFVLGFFVATVIALTVFTRVFE
jgi:hypothetical protein